MPHLIMLSDAYEDPLSTVVFAVAVPTHLGAVPVHDRASRGFQCASSTSMIEEGAAPSNYSATPHTDNPLQRLGRMIRHRQRLEPAGGGSVRTAPEILDDIWHVGVPDATMVADPTKRSLTWSEMWYICFSQQAFYRSASHQDSPAGQSEVSIAEEDSARWRRDAAESAARLYREDLHLARVNAALFQISNDILSTSVDDVHARAEPVIHFADRAPLQPTGDADLDRLYRALWDLESFLDETADSHRGERNYLHIWYPDVPGPLLRVWDDVYKLQVWLFEHVSSIYCYMYLVSGSDQIATIQMHLSSDAARSNLDFFSDAGGHFQGNDDTWTVSFTA